MKPKEVRQAVAAHLNSAPLEGVDTVYPYEPDRQVTGPVYVGVQTAGVTTDAHLVAVVVYSVLAGHVGSAAASDALDDAVVAVDGRLAGATLGPSDWVYGRETITIGDEARVYSLTARCVLEVGRSDLMGGDADPWGDGLGL